MEWRFSYNETANETGFALNKTANQTTIFVEQNRKQDGEFHRTKQQTRLRIS